jgi:cytochrome c biogenesis protein CcmG/thiol:disulfide interchange protein DsbE
VVVVNFWSSWCAACVREHDDLAAAWRRFREQGVVLLGILHQDTAENAHVFRQLHGGDWPIAVDPGSATALDYGVVGLPETFFIGRDGDIAHKHVGEATYEVLVEWMDRLVREDPRGP